jgi:fructosamine-3-kinase
MGLYGQKQYRPKMNREKLKQITGEEITGMFSVSGGCIADSKIITTKSGRKFFLKQGFSNGMFAKEANGLKELAGAGEIRTPKIIDFGNDYLLLEYIDQSPPKTGFFEEFGKQLAMLHKHSSDKFGFFENNFIGKTPQKNQPSPDEAENWPKFYWNNRLIYQLRLTEKNGYADKEIIRLFSKLEEAYDLIIKKSDEPPSLIHGDLWGGNYMSNESGAPVLIDPAVYYGHREAELAMTKLFGGFSASFYKSYNEIWPLKEGSERREPLYFLYHIMNHLNLFGTDYYSQTISLLKKLTK